MTSEPRHYTVLKPLCAQFQTGLPMLMYHKLGPTPWRAKVKGLYVSEAGFRHQLQELRAAGYTSCALDDWASAAATANKIVLSFDDGFANTLSYGLAALRDTGFQAIQYLLADAIGGSNDWDAAHGEVPERLMDANEVREWLAGGQLIGSHSSRHVRLTELPLAQAREEISASKKKLEDRFGLPIRHFCYPYGAWNPAIRDLVQEAGYATASTVDRGVNTAATHPLELRRYMARSPSWAERLFA